jgi:hypothetical protein
MSGQVSQIGAIALANKLGGIGGVVIQSSMPTFVPGLVWINDSTSPPVQMVWNSETWVDGPEELFVALLTGDPSVAGQDGGYAETVADIVPIEDNTAGYARQPVTFANVPALYNGSDPYVIGDEVMFQGFVYTNAISGTGVAPTGAESSNDNWTYTPNGGYPGEVANSDVLTWGPYTAAQTLPVQFAALVTCSSGSVGLLRYMWTLPAPQQVNISQSIQAGVGSLILAES